MNFVYTAVSMFITNYIFMEILRLLPFIKASHKKTVQTIVISIINLGTLFYYGYMLISNSLELYDILYILGNILAVIIAYIATLMMVLDGKSLLKSKRRREFERELMQKDSNSLSRNIIFLVCLILGSIALVFGIISLTNYQHKLLITLIGEFVGALIFYALSLYFFISNRKKGQTIKTQNLLFIVNLPSEKICFKASINKEFTINNALGSLEEMYLLDEYGLIITQTEKYLVKGIKLDSYDKSIEQRIKMEKWENVPFVSVLSEFQKYNRKKIILDENNQVSKITNIK